MVFTFTAFTTLLIVSVIAAYFSFQNPMRDVSVPLPWPLFITKAVLSSTLRAAADSLMDPPIKVLDDFFGILRSQIIHSCTEFGIADILATGPHSVAEISAKTSIKNSELLLRLLRAAQGMGYFEETSNGLWKNNLYSNVLRTDHPNSLNSIIKFYKDGHFPYFERLAESIENGEELMFTKYNNGSSFWQYLQNDPVQEKLFSKAMINFNSFSEYAMAHDFDWGKYTRIIDFGGAYGSFLACVLNSYPHLSGLLFDLPNVVENAQILWNSAHVELVNRVSIVGGSFFETVTFPLFQDNDVVVLRNILHDWSDDEAIKILTNLRAAIGNNNVTIALLEMSLTTNDIAFRYFFDIIMHVMLHGKERYKKDWEKLFTVTGYELKAITDTRSLYRVVVAKTV